jgi:hypothetical protein
MSLRGREPYRVALYMPPRGEDVLRLDVKDGASFGLGPNQMLLCLATEVDWAKDKDG